jgi:predicted aldo/keto reductase-like oxidoreductase
VTVTAAAAGTWQLGDLTVNRLGFGAMRLTGGAVFGRGAPSDRDRSISVLRRAVELGVSHIDTAARSSSASATSTPPRPPGRAVPTRRRCHRSPGRSSPARRASQGRW